MFLINWTQKSCTAVKAVYCNIQNYQQHVWYTQPSVVNHCVSIFGFNEWRLTWQPGCHHCQWQVWELPSHGSILILIISTYHVTRSLSISVKISCMYFQSFLVLWAPIIVNTFGLNRFPIQWTLLRRRIAPLPTFVQNTLLHCCLPLIGTEWNQSWEKLSLETTNPYHQVQNSAIQCDPDSRFLSQTSDNLETIPHMLVVNNWV